MKHADASKITLDIKNRENVMFISYTDNGKGFEPGPGKKEGMGLYNIKNRVETFGGRLAIESPLNKGIRVNIEIPL